MVNFIHIRAEPRKIILLFEKASHNDNSTKNLHMIQGGSGPYFYEYLHSRIAARNDQPLTNTLTSRLGTSATDSQRRGERVACSAKREGPVAAIAEKIRARSGSTYRGLSAQALRFLAQSQRLQMQKRQLHAGVLRAGLLSLRQPRLHRPNQAPLRKRGLFAPDLYRCRRCQS